MEVVAEVVRSGLVESRHRGTVVHVAPDGDVVWAVGDPDVVVFPRSTNKPFQALGLLRAGLPLSGPLLALAMASHSGEQVHLDGVRAILAEAGLEESALQTPASWPLDPLERDRVVAGGGGPAPILMDCSGKHAAMLLTCVVNGWPTDTYLAPDHPVQERITATFAEVVEEPPVIGVDGCGAPLLAARLSDLARGFSAVRHGVDDHAGRLVEAWMSHPTMVSGTRRAERDLMAAVPGLVAKSGAESVYVAALADGSAVAVKIEDGAERPLYAVLNRALERAGVGADLLAERPAVLGGGHPVGEVRVTF